MRIQNKYLRNRHFRIKHWKRIRALEHPHRTFWPWSYYRYYSVEEQVENSFESITKRARALESGSTKYSWEAPSHFRRQLTRERKAQERAIMQKINNGRYDIELPEFKRDAAWIYW